MPSTTFVARTETGIVTRSSATRRYAYAVLVKSANDGKPEGAWGWSGDRANAEKAAQQARKVYSSVRVVPVLMVQRTEPAFAQGSADLAWHAVDLAGNPSLFSHTKADVIARIGASVVALEPAASYTAALLSANGRTEQVFAICSGETAAQMLKSSTTPDRLRFHRLGN